MLAEVLSFHVKSNTHHEEGYIRTTHIHLFLGKQARLNYMDIYGQILSNSQVLITRNKKKRFYGLMNLSVSKTI
jgi:hypothetical protein